MILNPNCSEAVFRFYTTDPEQIQKILQLIADEIDATTDIDEHRNQKIPLLDKAEDYDTKYKPPTHEEREEHYRIMDELNSKRLSGEISMEEYANKVAEEHERYYKKIYPNALLRACAGMGDNEAIVTVEQHIGAFRLNIGNNDISDNMTGWIEKVLDMRIKVEEAETSHDLARYARDCTCGIVYFHNEPVTPKIDEKRTKAGD